MSAIESCLWWGIELLGVALVILLSCESVWRLLPWFTTLQWFTVITSPMLQTIHAAYPTHYYYWPYILCHALTLLLQCLAFMELLFMWKGKGKPTSAAKMGFTLLAYWLTEWLVMADFSTACNFTVWRKDWQLDAALYIPLQLAWLYWTWRIVLISRKENERYVC